MPEKTSPTPARKPLKSRKSLRLLGDGNGDRFVNSGDFCAFRGTYLADPQSETFDPAFDLNQDGFINSADFRLFRQQNLKGIPHENDG